MLALAAAVGLVSVASLTAYVAARSITRPLGKLVGTTLTLAGGDTGVTIQGGERKDEIGGIARGSKASRAPNRRNASRARAGSMR